MTAEPIRQRRAPVRRGCHDERVSTPKMQRRDWLMLLTLVLLALGTSGPLLIVTTRTGFTAFGACAAAIVLAALIATICFFFPDQTILRLIRWWQRRVRFRNGALTYDDAEWLARRYTPTPVPPNRYGDAFVWSLAGMIYTRVRVSEELNYPADPRAGKAVVRWLRKRHDPVLLLDALVADMSAAELEAHLDGHAPLDPAATAMLAGLQPHRRPANPA